MKKTAQFIRGLAALGALIGVVAAPPVLLVRLAGWPLPHAIPTWKAATTGISNGIPDAVVIDVLACCAWILWAQIVASLVIEIPAALRAETARRLPATGAIQPLVAKAVAAITLSFTSLPTIATTVGALPMPAPEASLLLSPRLASHVAVEAAIPLADSSTELPRYVVKPGDSLWKIAQTTLGDPQRFEEIFRLNVGVPQAHPRGALQRRSMIRPGWLLTLPADATVPSTPSDPQSIPPAVLPMVPANPATEQPAQPLDTPAISATTAPTPTTEAPVDVAQRGGHLDQRQDRHQNPTPQVVDKSDRPAVPAPLLAALVGAPLVAAAAGLSRLDAVRRLRHRSRRPGRDLPAPVEADQHAEAVLRSIPVGEAHLWVDVTLRYLARVLTEQQAEPRPNIVGARAGALGVEVLVDPASKAPAGLEQTDANTWRLPDNIDLYTLLSKVHDFGPLVPALVPIGDTADGEVLVDLEHVGALSITGDVGRGRSLMAWLAVSLATSNWSTGVEVASYGLGPDLDRLRSVHPGIRTLTDERSLLAAAEGAALARRKESFGGGSMIDRRLSDRTDWSPFVVLVGPDAELDDEVLSRLVATAQPHTSGVVVIAGRPLPGANWELAIEASGTALLEPLGLPLCVSFEEQLAASMTSLLEQATDETDLERTEAPSDEPESMLSGRLAVASAVPAEGELEVKILGSVEFTGWPEEHRRRRKWQEVVGFLAVMATDPVPTGRIAEAMWPDRDGRQSNQLNELLSRTRAALGRDSEGRSFVPEAESGTYQAPTSMTTDWDRFRSTTQMANWAADEDAEAAHLRSALELVRGQPFDGVPSGTWGWAWSTQLVYEIEVAVVDAAERLASLALARNDRSTVEWAVSRGLLVAPTSEPLHELRMRAAAAAGDAHRVQAGWREACRAVTAIDPTDEPSDDLRDTVARLLAEVGPTAPPDRRASQF